MHEITQSYRYSAFGLEIASPFALPALLPSAVTAEPDVTIRISRISPKPDGHSEIGRLVINTPAGPIFYWRDVANFHIENGSIIHVHPLKDATESGIAEPLTGVVLGALLHERGIFCLHASAIVTNGRAVAFVGDKGAGKTTLTASLLAVGCDLVTDDILAFLSTNDSHGYPVVIPSFPQLKLSKNSSVALGFNFDDLSEISRRSEKRAVRDPSVFFTRPAPLSTLYVLSEGPILECNKVGLKDALLNVIQHSYATRILGPSANTKNHFLAMQHLIQNVRTVHLRRPKNIDRLSEIANFVLDDELQGGLIE